MKIICFSLSLFCSFNSFSQSTGDSSVYTALPDISELRQYSRLIDHESFDFKFVINVLPDNFWLLYLFEDLTYKYVFLDGFSGNETLLESGKYQIINNRIFLSPSSPESLLTSCDFYLFSALSDISNHIYIDCDETGGTMYCLCR